MNRDRDGREKTGERRFKEVRRIREKGILFFEMYSIGTREQ